MGLRQRLWMMGALIALSATACIEAPQERDEAEAEADAAGADLDQGGADAAVGDSGPDDRWEGGTVAPGNGGRSGPGECSVDADCDPDRQCVAYSCYPAGEECDCVHVLDDVVPLEECSYWAYEETGDLIDPRSVDSLTYRETSTDYRVVCDGLSGFGDPCAAGAECRSGLCAGFCTRECDMVPCPEGWACVMAEDGRAVCAPGG